MKINILYVIWSLGLGGAEQVVINLAKGLDKTKFQPFVCCLNDEGRFADVLKKEGIRVFALNKARGLDFSVIPKLVHIIGENDIRIVHTHLWGASFWGRIAARVARVKVIITEHNVDVWKSMLHFLIDRFLFKKTDCFIAVSETVRNFYSAKLCVPAEKIKVVYNGIDVAAFSRQSSVSSLKKEFEIKNDEKVISVIGRLVPQKGFDIFLEAFSRLSLNARALIVGEGPLLESLKVSTFQSSTLKDKVIFTGLRKDIPEILSITDILVLPSKREGLPMILLEAMAAGAIVVASRVGGTPEVVEDGINGFLVEPQDVEGLKDKIEYILNADSRELDKIREAAQRTIAEKFSLEKMVAEHEKIYEQI